MHNLHQQQFEILKKDFTDAMREVGKRVGEHEELFGKIVTALNNLDTRLEHLEKLVNPSVKTEE